MGASADTAQRHLLELATERLLAESSRRAAAQAGAGGGAAGPASSSNYDFVKIKVRLGTHLEHYYILSRFLLSRMLTVITLPQHKAVRIALDVKKHLVDHNRLDITQEELEEVLFAQLRQRGYGDEYVSRYQMVTRFFQQQRPLIVLVAGSACTGKSSLAQQLASRLNLPNVLQTDVLYELLRSSGTGDLPAQPLWQRPLPAGANLVGEFQKECATIRRALDGDLCKCIRDGKSIIIEGLHIDPGLFLREFGDPRGEAVLMQPADSLTLPPVLAEQQEEQQHEEQQQQAGEAVEVAGEAAAAPGAAQADAGAGIGTVASTADGEAEAQQLEQLTLEELAPDVQQAWQQQQAEPSAGTAPASPAGSASAAAARSGVKRSASFGDAAPALSYSSLHRQESPWRDVGQSKALLRPRSARVGDSRLSMRRGQAVFMLQSNVEASSDGEPGSPGPAQALVMPPPVPSPRLAACISLPTVREHSPDQQLRGQEPGSPAVEAGGGEEGGAAGALAESVHHHQAVPALDLDSPSQPALADADAAGAAQTPPAAEQAAPQQAQQQQQQQHEQQPGQASVAVADAAAAAAAGTGPVFVPICLAVPDEEYEGMLLDWLALQPSNGSPITAGGSGEPSAGPAGSSAGAAGAAGGPQVPAAEAAARLRSLQAHLRRYAASGVPVVELDVNDMGRALDSVHSYVLQCIALAMGDAP